MANTNELKGIFVDFFSHINFVLVFFLSYYCFTCVLVANFVFLGVYCVHFFVLRNYSGLFCLFVFETEKGKAWSWVGREDGEELGEEKRWSEYKKIYFQ